MPSDDSFPESTDITLRVSSRKFGRYKLLDRLGAGGMADVYLALSTGSFDAKKLVVLKQPRAFAHDFVDMFMDEARLAMRLNHPNVVQTYDVGVHDGSFFLAMEYLEGQPLNRLLGAMITQNEHLSHAHLARIVSEALAGLHYAHELCDYDGTPLKIVHRDVSPQNLFVTYDGQIKVVDFGIAKASVNLTQTESGALKGKVAYMSPEHAAGTEVDPRTDVFSMGIVLWEMLARRRLVKGVSAAELLNHMLTMEFPSITSEAPDVHPLLEAVVTKSLQRDPAARYPSALEMRDALDAFVAASGAQVRSSELGAMVSKLFAGEREQMEAKVRAHMRSSSPTPSSRPGPRSGETTSIETPSPRSSRSASDVDHASEGSVRTGMPVVATTTPAGAKTAQAERRSVVTIAALLISIATLALVIVVARGDNSPPASNVSANAAAAPTTETTATPTPTVALSIDPTPPAPTPSALASASASSSVAHPTRPVPTPTVTGSTARPVRPIDTSFPR